MTREQIIRDLDRLRAEIDKPEPDLRDVMDRLESIERRLSGLESRPVVRERIVERPYPYRPWPYQVAPTTYPWWQPGVIYSTTTQGITNGPVPKATLTAGGA